MGEINCNNCVFWSCNQERSQGVCRFSPPTPFFAGVRPKPGAIVSPQQQAQGEPIIFAAFPPTQPDTVCGCHRKIQAYVNPDSIEPV